MVKLHYMHNCMRVHIHVGPTYGRMYLFTYGC